MNITINSGSLVAVQVHIIFHSNTNDKNRVPKDFSRIVLDGFMLFPYNTEKYNVIIRFFFFQIKSIGNVKGNFWYSPYSFLPSAREEEEEGKEINSINKIQMS